LATNEPQSVADYKQNDLDRILGEAAHVLRIIGFAGAGLTIIGGLVPTLLVPVVDPAYAQPHVGTRDVDLCLSIALIEDGAQGYERIETQLRENGFQATDVSFRWLHPSGTEVEFFCPAGEGRIAGRMYRPPAGPARQTMGGHLTALALDGGELLTSDRRIVTRTVRLPGDKGLLDFDFPVTGPAGFLAAKVSAVHDRNKDKDSYDLVWLLDAWSGGPGTLAREIVAGTVQAHPAAIHALHTQLAAAFASEDHHGPLAYARFVGAGEVDLEQRAELALHAYGAVQAYLADANTA
jgi:hypothetical protein